MVEFAVNNPALVEPDRSDIQLLYTAYLVSRGDYARAKSEFTTFGNVSPANNIVRECLTAVFKARAGNPADLQKFMAQKFIETEAHLIAQGVGALALADLGRNDEAMEHLALFTQYQSTMVSSIPQRCVERYLKLLKANGKVGESDNALFEILKVNQTSPAIMASYFGAKPGIDAYSGHLSADTKWVSDQNYDSKNPTHKDEYQSAAIGQGQIEMTVGIDGHVSGSLKITDGNSFELTGTVDQFGNLRGKAKGKNQVFDVEAKLISNEYRKSERFTKSSIGQMINVYDAKGLVTHWMMPSAVLKP